MENHMDRKKQTVDRLCASLRNHPEDWTPDNPVDVWTLSYKRGRVSLIFGMNSAELRSPAKVKFGWIGWWRLRRAYRAWRRARGQTLQSSATEAALLHVLEQVQS